MWLRQPIWMLRYHLSSWMLTAAMAVMPSPRYRTELRRRVLNLRDETIAEVLAHRGGATVTPSSGCVFCDLKLNPTNCTDGWFHLMSDGRTIPCAVKK